MSSVLRFFRSLVGYTPARLTRTALSPDLSRFAVGDRVLINGQKLTAPLRPNQKHDLPTGFISHDDIIGKPAKRSQIQTNTGVSYEIRLPDLDQYVSLTPRKVTPVYATYASLIVSLLDIHVALPTSQNLPSSSLPLEILESGTGHGSLTLHLSRAIAAANPPPPSTAFAEQSSTPDWAAWRTSRRAILHSVEINPTYQSHAEKIVRSFRQGIYWPHVDFSVSSVGDWVASQLDTRGRQTFLSHVVLDMPSVHNQIAKVVDGMREDAVLAVFVPSVTQIGDCIRMIDRGDLPLKMEKAVEMGEGISNGRIWDIRLVKPRIGADAVSPSESEASSGAEDTAIIERGVPGLSDTDEPVMVCRPMVGNMTIGGGFVGLWRKVASADEARSVKKREKNRKRRR